MLRSLSCGLGKIINPSLNLHIFFWQLSYPYQSPTPFTARFLKRAVSSHSLNSIILASSPITKLKQFRLSLSVTSILPTPWTFYMTHCTWSSITGHILISLYILSMLSIPGAPMLSYQLHTKDSKFMSPAHIYHLSFRLKLPSWHLYPIWMFKNTLNFMSKSKLDVFLIPLS